MLMHRIFLHAVIDSQLRYCLPRTTRLGHGGNGPMLFELGGFARVMRNRCYTFGRAAGTTVPATLRCSSCRGNGSRSKNVPTNSKFPIESRISIPVGFARDFRSTAPWLRGFSESYKRCCKGSRSAMPEVSIVDEF